ncbi:MAG: SgcJ/EcaC family oxidoreductase, partial [Bacteroidota bacterium]
VKDSTGAMVTKPDNQQLKAEIQALENEWAKADNAGDATALAAFYSDDAVSLSNNKPMITGNAAIKKDMEDGMAKRVKGSTVAYDVMDAYGCDNYVTEVGKITRKDSTGKTVYTGKYMALWEKQDGKWICIRDIGNDDVKSKD